MSIRAAFLFATVTLVGVTSARAQPANSLQARVANLEANVATLQTSLANLAASFAKLDENNSLTPADLAGTYAVQAIDIPMSAAIPAFETLSSRTTHSTQPCR
jgi:hypothetical protein